MHCCHNPAVQINALPTVYELVSGRAQGVAAAEAKAARVVRPCSTALPCAAVCCFDALGGCGQGSPRGEPLLRSAQRCTCCNEPGHVLQQPGGQ